MVRSHLSTTTLLLAAVAASISVASEEPTVDPIPQQQGVEVQAIERELIVDRHANGQPKTEREVALDHEENFVNHGVMRVYSDRGVFIGGGQYKWGERHGKWVRIYNDAGEAALLNQVSLRGFQAPYISEANFVSDLVDGVWLIKDAAERPIVRWEFAGGKRNGQWIWYDANGSIRQQINYRDDHIVGDVLGAANGEKPQVLQRHIEGRRLVVDAEKYPNGKLKKQGQLLLPRKRTAVRMDWWAGNVEELVLRTDGERVRHGEYQYWYENGQPKMKGTYNVGKETGIFSWYYENGEKQTEGNYINGRRDGEWQEWYANGQLKGAGKYVSGLRSGQWRTWFDNGMRQRDAEFHGGQQVGIVRAWNRGGARINLEEAEESQEIADGSTERVTR